MESNSSNEPMKWAIGRGRGSRAFATDARKEEWLPTVGRGKESGVASNSVGRGRGIGKSNAAECGTGAEWRPPRLPGGRGNVDNFPKGPSCFNYQVGRQDQKRGSPPSRGRGRGAPGSFRNSRPFPGEFVHVDRETKFHPEHHVAWVSVLDDEELVRDIHLRLSNFTRGPKDFFPASWPVNLDTSNLDFLQEPYVVAPKAKGPRFLLYVGKLGDIYLENMTQQVFRIEESHAIRMATTDTLLDGILAEKQHLECPSGVDPSQLLVFVVHDAIRVNGVDLINFGIQKRLARVEEEIMKPRNEARQDGASGCDSEAFGIDVISVKEVELAADYLAEDFERKYSLRSLIFHPRTKGYRCGSCSDLLQWNMNAAMEFNFRLKIVTNPTSGCQTGKLMVIGPRRVEMNYADIKVDEQLLTMDNGIIECRLVDNEWVLIRQRFDRNHPNGLRTINGKMDAVEHPVTRDLLMSVLERSRVIQ